MSASRAPRVRRWMLALALAVGALAPASLAAQAGSGNATTVRHLRGRVLTPADSGEPNPVPGAWVTLHRIGVDSAGPVDSVRTSRDGRWSFDVRVADDDSASWIASSMRAGIAHFSGELGGGAPSEEAGEIVVFDTTGAPVPMHVMGRHLVVFAAKPGEPRDVMEVYEIENDSPRTAVSRNDASPVWTAPLPPQARDARVGEGDLDARAVRFDSGSMRVYAPILPGLRQISFRYRLPPGAFPLRVPLREGAEVFEVLVEEPLARVTAPGLVEQERTTNEGHQFRRFLARHAAQGSVVTVEVPERAANRRVPVVIVVATLGVLAMATALVVALRRPRDASTRRAVSAAD